MIFTIKKLSFLFESKTKYETLIQQNKCIFCPKTTMHPKSFWPKFTSFFKFPVVYPPASVPQPHHSVFIQSLSYLTSKQALGMAKKQSLKWDKIHQPFWRHITVSSPHKLTHTGKSIGKLSFRLFLPFFRSLSVSLTPETIDAMGHQSCLSIVGSAGPRIIP